MCSANRPDRRSRCHDLLHRSPAPAPPQPAGRAFGRIPNRDSTALQHCRGHGRPLGTQPARWFEILVPQPKPQHALRDTFFTGDDAWPATVVDTDAVPLPKTGRFKAENPLPPMGGGLQQGLSVYRFMERQFGAQCFFMMRGEMAAGAFRTQHDHPLEEFYLGLSGEVIMDIEGQSFRLGAGDVAWTGVGTSHAFRHTGAEPFRWLETQTPQFPAQYGTRNYVAWEKLRAGR